MQTSSDANKHAGANRATCREVNMNFSLVGPHHMFNKAQQLQPHTDRNELDLPVSQTPLKAIGPVQEGCCANSLIAASYAKA